MSNRHWPVQNDDITQQRDRGTYDVVTCISVLEHIADPVHAMRSMADALAPGGHLILTTPYNENRHVPDVYTLPGAAIRGPLPYICRSSSRTDLTGWCEASSLEVVEQEYWRLWTGDVWRQGEWTTPALVEKDEPHQLTCLLLRRACAQHARSVDEKHPKDEAHR